MTMISLGKQELLYMNALQSAAGVMAKDCIEVNGTIVFIVQSNDLGKAIGKQGKNVKWLSAQTKKGIQVYAHADTVEEFIRNAWQGHTLKEIRVEEKAVIVSAEEKRKLLQNKLKLQVVKEILKRNYNIENMIIR